MQAITKELGDVVDADKHDGVTTICKQPTYGKINRYTQAHFTKYRVRVISCLRNATT